MSGHIQPHVRLIKRTSLCDLDFCSGMQAVTETGLTKHGDIFSNKLFTNLLFDILPRSTLHMGCGFDLMCACVWYSDEKCRPARLSASTAIGHRHRLVVT